MKLLTIFIIFSFFALNVYTQELNTTTILGEEYGLMYSKSDNMFTICEKINSGRRCFQQSIESDNTFEFVKQLEETMHKLVADFEFQYFRKQLKQEDFKSIDFKDLEIDFDIEALRKGDTVPLIITEAPKDFDAKILKKEDQKIDNDKENIQGNDSAENALEIIVISENKIFNLNELKTTEENLNDSKIFSESLKTALNTRRDTIVNYYKEQIKTEFNKLIETYYNTVILKDAEYKFLATRDLVIKNNDSENKSTFNFYILHEKNQFNLKTSLNDTPYFFNDLKNDISEAEFIAVLTTKNQLFTDNDSNETIFKELYLITKTNVQDVIIEKQKKEFEEGLQNTIAALEKGPQTYSGQFVLKNEVVLKEGELKGIIYKNFKYNGDERKTLIVDSVKIHLFNNRADRISIIGKFKDKPKETIAIKNSLWSLPLREFQFEEQQGSYVHDGKIFLFNYKDVLDYLPYENYNYAARNGNYTVKSSDSTRVVERKIGDYFTGIFFSDVLGLNSNNGNGLLIAEGRLRVPWNLRNIGRSTWFDNITAYASVVLLGGIENNTRKITINQLQSEGSTNNESINTSIDNFSLLDLNNVDAGISVTPYTFEWKGASTFIHLRYGLRFLRTAVTHNLNEEVTLTNQADETITQQNLLRSTDFQVYSIGQEAEINFEFRPQSLIGGDLTVGLNWFGETGTNDSDINISAFNNTPNLKVMTNIYAYTNSESSNAGIYVRFGGHYNLGNSRIFPQLMVGYATNLSSFVNKLSGKQ